MTVELKHIHVQTVGVFVVQPSPARHTEHSPSAWHGEGASPTSRPEAVFGISLGIWSVARQSPMLQAGPPRFEEMVVAESEGRLHQPPPPPSGERQPR